MKKVSVLTYFLFFLLGGVALWYLGLYRSAQETLKTEPKKIFKVPETAKEKQHYTGIVTPEHLDDTGIESSTTPDDVAIESNPESTNAASAFPVKNSQDASSKSSREQSEQEASEHESLTKEAERKKLELLKQEKAKTAAALKEAALLQNEAHAIIANQLKTMPVEKQQATLKQMKEAIFNTPHPLTQKPLYETPEVAKVAWQDLLDGIVKMGYTPPEGYK